MKGGFQLEFRLLGAQVLSSISEIQVSWLRQRSGYEWSMNEAEGWWQETPIQHGKESLSPQGCGNTRLGPVFNHRFLQQGHNTEGVVDL